MRNQYVSHLAKSSPAEARILSTQMVELLRIDCMC